MVMVPTYFSYFQKNPPAPSLNRTYFEKYPLIFMGLWRSLREHPNADITNWEHPAHICGGLWLPFQWEKVSDRGHNELRPRMGRNMAIPGDPHLCTPGA